MKDGQMVTLHVRSVPHGHWKTNTFIAALRCDGLQAPWLLDGPHECRCLFNLYR